MIVELWMKEDFSNPNIEWKKNNSDPSERLTLRINHKEAAAYSATKKNSFNASAMPVAENLPKGLKKIRKKFVRLTSVPIMRTKMTRISSIFPTVWNS